jgi:hypothetical protein
MNYQLDYIMKVERYIYSLFIILHITLKCGIYLEFIVISCGVVRKSGSTDFIMLIDNKYTTFRTSLKYLLTVSLKCWNLF